MDDVAFDKIEAFLSNAMGDEERRTFEKELAADPALAARLQMYRHVQDTLTQSIQNKSHEDLLKQTLSDVYAQHIELPAQLPVRKLAKWYYVAVAAALFAIISTVYLFQSKSPDDLYAGYAVFPVLSADRGTTDSLYSIAVSNYNNTNYKEAAGAFTKILAKDTGNLEVRLYLGISYLQSNSIQQSMSEFKRIAAYENVYTNQAKWYIALTYLKQNKLDSCKKMLQQIPADADTYTRARKLSDDLK